MGHIAVVLDRYCKVAKQGRLYVIDGTTGKYREHQDPKLDMEQGHPAVIGYFLTHKQSGKDKYLSSVDRIVVYEGSGLKDEHKKKLKEGGGLEIVEAKEGTHVDDLVKKYSSGKEGSGSENYKTGGKAQYEAKQARPARPGQKKGYLEALLEFLGQYKNGEEDRDSDKKPKNLQKKK